MRPDRRYVRVPSQTVPHWTVGRPTALLAQRRAGPAAAVGEAGAAAPGGRPADGAGDDRGRVPVGEDAALPDGPDAAARHPGTRLFRDPRPDRDDVPPRRGGGAAIPRRSPRRAEVRTGTLLRPADRRPLPAGHLAGAARPPDHG